MKSLVLLVVVAGFVGHVVGDVEAGFDYATSDYFDENDESEDAESLDLHSDDTQKAAKELFLEDQEIADQEVEDQEVADPRITVRWIADADAKCEIHSYVQYGSPGRQRQGYGCAILTKKNIDRRRTRWENCPLDKMCECSAAGCSSCKDEMGTSRCQGYKNDGYCDGPNKANIGCDKTCEICGPGKTPAAQPKPQPKPARKTVKRPVKKTQKKPKQTKKPICTFVSGDGAGGREIKLKSRRTGLDCAETCFRLRSLSYKPHLAKYKNVNGATVLKNGKSGCWCEIGMKTRTASSKYKSCFLPKNANKDEPEVEVPLADPAVGMAQALPSVDLKEDELSEIPLADPAAEKCQTTYKERCKKGDKVDKTYIDLTKKKMSDARNECLDQCKKFDNAQGCEFFTDGARSHYCWVHMESNVQRRNEAETTDDRCWVFKC